MLVSWCIGGCIGVVVGAIHVSRLYRDVFRVRSLNTATLESVSQHRVMNEIAHTKRGGAACYRAGSCTCAALSKGFIIAPGTVATIRATRGVDKRRHTDSAS